MLSVLWRSTGQGSEDHRRPNGSMAHLWSRWLRLGSYRSRLKALPTVDVCILPYNLLLVPSARESCGIDLTNSVVIIDEAHNLAGAIESSYSNVLGSDSIFSKFRIGGARELVIWANTLYFFESMVRHPSSN